jgi:hypothetical protein
LDLRLRFSGGIEKSAEEQRYRADQSENPLTRKEISFQCSAGKCG